MAEIREPSLRNRQIIAQAFGGESAKSPVGCRYAVPGARDGGPPTSVASEVRPAMASWETSGLTSRFRLMDEKGLCSTRGTSRHHKPKRRVRRIPGGAGGRPRGFHDGQGWGLREGRGTAQRLVGHARAFEQLSKLQRSQGARKAGSHRRRRLRGRGDVSRVEAACRFECLATGLRARLPD